MPCYKVKGQKEGIGVGIFWVELGALVYLGSIFVSVFCWCHGVCLKIIYFWGVCGFLWSGFGRLFKGREWACVCVCPKGCVLVSVRWDWGEVTVWCSFFQEGRLIDWWNKVDSSPSQVDWDFIWRTPKRHFCFWTLPLLWNGIILLGVHTHISIGPWTAGTSMQWILKEINPEQSLEELMP